MKKRVNIYPRGPITTTNPPIRVPVKNVTKDTKDIRRCILAGAKVEEVLDNGVVVLLNLNNYDVENPGTVGDLTNESFTSWFTKNTTRTLTIEGTVYDIYSRYRSSYGEDNGFRIKFN